MEKLFGFHAGVKTKAGLAAYAAGVEEFLAPLGVNCVVIEINNNFAFKTHPELSESDITHEDLRAAADKIRAAGVEPVPLYNCMGHQGWAERNSLLKAYPEFDETPDLRDGDFFKANQGDDGKMRMLKITPGWCGNEPRVFDVVLPAMDELVQATGCKRIHLGMDEIFYLANCQRCRHMSPQDLFYQTFMRLYNHFKEMSVGVMIWADRILDCNILGERGWNRWYDYESMGISGCIDKMPKDIIACNWHYDVERSYPSTGYLIDHGIAPWPSCWDNPQAAHALWNDSLRQARERNNCALLPGILVTGWGMRNLYDAFTKPVPEITEREAGIAQCLKQMGQVMKEYNQA